jgi:hypothetical protein
MAAEARGAVSYLIGDCFVIQEEDEQKCALCQELAECRPRANGDPICSDCGERNPAIYAEVRDRQQRLVEQSKFCLQAPKGMKVTQRMIEEARQRAFG